MFGWHQNLTLALALTQNLNCCRFLWCTFYCRRYSVLVSNTQSCKGGLRKLCKSRFQFWKKQTKTKHNWHFYPVRIPQSCAMCQPVIALRAGDLCKCDCRLPAGLSSFYMFVLKSIMGFWHKLERSRVFPQTAVEDFLDLLLSLQC